MKTTLQTHDIAQALRNDNNANWSYHGSFALAEYLEGLESELGEETELDIVSIRCEFSEFKCLGDWAVEYFGGIHQACAGLHIGATHDGAEDDTIREYITIRGALIEFNDGIIVSSF